MRAKKKRSRSGEGLRFGVHGAGEQSVPKKYPSARPSASALKHARHAFAPIENSRTRKPWWLDRDDS